MYKTLLLAGAAFCLFTANANASYVSAKINFADTSFDTTDTWSAGSYDYDLSDKVWGLSVAGGISLPLIIGAVRAELEYNWHNNAEEDVSFKNIALGKAALKSQSLFLNAYCDIYTGTGFVPYVGFGLGYAKVEGEFSVIDMIINKDDNNFAWQVGAGIAYEVTRNIAIDFGYKYRNMGKISKTYAAGAELELDAISHELALGLRLSF